jgi:diaminopimelate epimerase
MAAFRILKAHAYGNDFLLAPRFPAAWNASRLAARMCHRHQGIGADGLIEYTLRPAGATMRLWNADGSPSELSGNGLRCLAALVARDQQLDAGRAVDVDTDAGVKRLDLLAVDGSRYSFRAALGLPTHVRETTIDVNGERIRATLLGMGNPQCVVLGPLPGRDRFERLGQAPTSSSPTSRRRTRSVFSFGSAASVRRPPPAPAPRRRRSRPRRTAGPAAASRSLRPAGPSSSSGTRTACTSPAGRRS